MKTPIPMALAAIAATALLFAGCSSGGTDVFTIKVGDCISTSTGDAEVTEVPTVPCEEPHEVEVFHDFEITGTDYPGEDEIFAQADQGCYDAFESFVGLSYEESELDWSYYYPTEGSWQQQGDRLISCLIFDPAGTTTGSLEGAAR